MHNHYYYSQTLSKDSSIDHILDPIIHKIKHDNIISFSQLKQTELPHPPHTFTHNKPNYLPHMQARMNRTLDSSLTKQSPQKTDRKNQTLRLEKGEKGQGKGINFIYVGKELRKVPSIS